MYMRQILVIGQLTCSSQYQAHHSFQPFQQSPTEDNEFQNKTEEKHRVKTARAKKNHTGTLSG